MQDKLAYKLKISSFLSYFSDFNGFFGAIYYGIIDVHETKVFIGEQSLD